MIHTSRGDGTLNLYLSEPNRLPSLLPPAVHSICMITPYMKGEQRVMGPDPAADPWIDEVGPPGWVKTGMSSTQGAEKDFEHFEKGGADEDFFEGKSCCGKRVTSSAGLACVLILSAGLSACSRVCGSLLQT